LDNIRYINAPLKIVFQEDTQNSPQFKREYDKLSGSDDDSVSEWLRLAKAKGETSESDQVLLTLIVELHKKVDALSAFVKGEKVDYLELSEYKDITGIGYDNFKLKEEVLSEGSEYYGRVEMPFFPKREVPLYFRAINGNEAKILLIHERDVKDWSAYVVARERVMIREMRAKK